MTINFIVSTIVLVLIGLGLWKRREVKLHARLMLAAFFTDIVLLLWIELSRQAIETVVEKAGSPFDNKLLLFHVTVSLIVVVLYIILTVLGFRIMGGQRQLLKLHRNLAGVFLLCRLTNYVTSFMI